MLLRIRPAVSLGLFRGIASPSRVGDVLTRQIERHLAVVHLDQESERLQAAADEHVAEEGLVTELPDDPRSMLTRLSAHRLEASTLSLRKATPQHVLGDDSTRKVAAPGDLPLDVVSILVQNHHTFRETLHGILLHKEWGLEKPEPRKLLMRGENKMAEEDSELRRGQARIEGKVVSPMSSEFGDGMHLSNMRAKVIANVVDDLWHLRAFFDIKVELEIPCPSAMDEGRGARVGDHIAIELGSKGQLHALGGEDDAIGGKSDRIDVYKIGDGVDHLLLLQQQKAISYRSFGDTGKIGNLLERQVGVLRIVSQNPSIDLIEGELLLDSAPFENSRMGMALPPSTKKLGKLQAESETGLKGRAWKKRGEGSEEFRHLKYRMAEQRDRKLIRPTEFGEIGDLLRF